MSLNRDDVIDLIDDRLDRVLEDKDDLIVPIIPFSGRVSWHTGCDDGGDAGVIGIRQRADGVIEMIALVTGDNGMVWPQAFEQVQALLPS